MKNKLIGLFDRLALQQRGLVESVLNILKHTCHLEHHRHRSIPNFFVNLFASLASYSLYPHKPSIRLASHEEAALALAS